MRRTTAASASLIRRSTCDRLPFVPTICSTYKLGWHETGYAACISLFSAEYLPVVEPDSA